MSLIFDYENVNKPLPNGDDPTHAPFNKERWHPVGDALVWASLQVGIGPLDDKTIDLWERRLNILQKINGPLLRFVIDGKPANAYITRADLEAFKGMHTNARYAPYETQAQWFKRIFRYDEKPYAADQRPAYEIAHEAALQAADRKKES